MSWVLIIGVAWLLTAAAAALLIGRAIHEADRRERGASDGIRLSAGDDMTLTAAGAPPLSGVPRPRAERT